MERNIPHLYEHRVVAALEAIPDGNRTSIEAFRSVQTEIATRNLRAAEEHCEAMRQHDRRHLEVIDYLGDVSNGLYGVAEAVAESGAAVAEAIEIMAHRLGYELTEVNRSLRRIEVKADDMNRWLTSIAGSTETLVELIKHPREVEAIELANHSRVCLAIGRIEEGLALAERAHATCPTSVFVYGHLILALCSNLGRREEDRVATLIREMARLTAYRLLDPHTEVSVLQGEAVAVIPPVINAISRMFGARMFEPAGLLLSSDITALIVDPVLGQQSLTTLFDTPTLIGDLFWWQAYDVGVRKRARGASRDDQIASVAQYLERLLHSRTPIKQELEFVCSGQLSNNGILGEVLFECLTQHKTNCRHAVETWIGHRLGLEAATLLPDVRTAILHYTRGSSATYNEETRGIIREFESQLAEASAGFSKSASARVAVVAESVGSFVSWVESDAREMVSRQMQPLLLARREIDSLESDLKSCREDETRARFALVRARERLSKMKGEDAAPGAAIFIGGLLILITLTVLANGEELGRVFFGGLGLLFLIGGIVPFLLKGLAPQAVRNSERHLDSVSSRVRAMSSDLSKRKGEVDAREKDLRLTVEERLHACLAKIAALRAELDADQKTLADVHFGRFSEQLQDARNSFAADCMAGIDCAGLSTKCQKAGTGVLSLIPRGVQ